MKYQLKSATCEAMQLTEHNRKEVIAFLQRGRAVVEDRSWDTRNVWISRSSVVDTRPGFDAILLRPGDYVIFRGHNAYEVIPRETFEIQWEPMKTQAGEVK